MVARTVKHRPYIKVIVMIIMAFFLIVSIYLTISGERFVYHEKLFSEEIIDSPEKYITYKTEFCANKLTELAHEYYFLEKDINTEKEILTDSKISESQQQIIKIEQRELQIVKEEFYSYKNKCDQLDKKPNEEICEEFIKESLILLEHEKSNVDETIIIDQVEIPVDGLRKANRIYQGLKRYCTKLN